jgi:hypothetical protein
MPLVTLAPSEILVWLIRDYTCRTNHGQHNPSLVVFQSLASSYSIAWLNSLSKASEDDEHKVAVAPASKAVGGMTEGVMSVKRKDKGHNLGRWVNP